MRRTTALVAWLALASATAHAEENEWEIAATGYWNAPRGGDAYGSAIFAADRGALHLEARFNYEAVHAQSAFAGWTFAGGAEEGVKFELTPILGGVTGAVRGPIAGFEASIAGERFDYYIEAEYVRDRRNAQGSYVYAWSELAYTPAEWIRLGLVAQRTRAYGGDRELQRGGFVQLLYREKLTAGVYWFNPGSSEQIVIGSVGFSF